MTRKNRNGLIIVIIVLMLITSPMLISSLSGISEMNNLKNLINNGKEVEGKVVKYTKGRAYSNNDGFTYVVFRLYYEYEENDVIYKDQNIWQIRENYTEKVESRESWCKDQIDKSIKLLIANDGYCKVADDLYSDYKAQRDFVLIRGSIFGGIEFFLLVGLLVLIFYKSKNKNEQLSI